MSKHPSEKLNETLPAHTRLVGLQIQRLEPIAQKMGNMCETFRYMDRESMRLVHVTTFSEALHKGRADPLLVEYKKALSVACQLSVKVRDEYRTQTGVLSCSCQREALLSRNCHCFRIQEYLQNVTDSRRNVETVVIRLCVYRRFVACRCKTNKIIER